VLLIASQQPINVLFLCAHAAQG